MALSVFRCQGFQVRQDIAAMKLGTDAMLLASFLNHPSPSRIIDIGTGTGILALQAAYRFPEAKVLGIDMDEAAVVEAKHNFESSSFSSRLSVMQADVKMLEIKQQADLIICNPPYFEEATTSPDIARDLARSSHHLPRESLLDKVKAWIHPDSGRFQCIIPQVKSRSFIHAAEMRGLHPHRSISIFSRVGHSANRILLDFNTNRSKVDIPTRCLHIYDAHRYHPEYVEFTKSVYGKDLSKINLEQYG